ncbi:hypothetical protein DB31_8344 [Hyalangium minutum]|uniref:Uncharacterized protein n=1 Tax=Hyalangium minutum TaxID=394096 RepID=A0A085WH28_9BACT|nr:hypothetical protein DB31_8344 [Hyalangium minutum]
MGLLRQLHQRLRVVQAPERLVKGADAGFQVGLLLQQRLGLGVVVPEGGLRGVTLDQRDAGPLAVEVKDAPGARAGAPEGCRSSPSCRSPWCFPR